ncbi:MAG: hypothetical protein J6O61_05655 [Butyrivibrio sp.]|uniref:hypothetical protein n=1 Tax=Butyrivibrio sp. TaxID=28121 RepID=UPI001B1FAD10|nr:hypothetical protein [Butyrivibrio sp.]MBO6240311.1 hypothetical protein [Butyrivibrio sp.]
MNSSSQDKNIMTIGVSIVCAVLFVFSAAIKFALLMFAVIVGFSIFMGFRLGYDNSVGVYEDGSDSHENIKYTVMILVAYFMIMFIGFAQNEGVAGSIGFDFGWFILHAIFGAVGYSWGRKEGEKDSTNNRIRLDSIQAEKRERLQRFINEKDSELNSKQREYDDNNRKIETSRRYIRLIHLFEALNDDRSICEKYIQNVNALHDRANSIRGEIDRLTQEINSLQSNLRSGNYDCLPSAIGDAIGGLSSGVSFETPKPLRISGGSVFHETEEISTEPKEKMDLSLIAGIAVLVIVVLLIMVSTGSSGQ